VSLSKIFALGIFLIFSIKSQAQILDDSTKQLYGPKTTSFVTEREILANRYNIKTTDTSSSNMGPIFGLDTAFEGLHNNSFLFDNNNQGNISQDLGNYLTPLGPIYYNQPMEIGRRLGYDVYEPYTINPKNIKYYDTRSPYSSIYYRQGTKGQQGIEVEVSRNVTKRWNVGIDFRRMTSQRILGSDQQKQLHVGHYSFAFYTRYYSKNERYQILFNFTHLHHTHAENGGIFRRPNESIDSLFRYAKASIYLKNARSLEKRNNYHIFQEFSLNRNKTVQIYHILDKQYRVNRYSDDLKTDALFYRDFLLPTYFDQTRTEDRTDYNLWENNAGLKGTIGKFSWRLYGRQKRYNYSQNSYGEDSLHGQRYVKVPSANGKDISLRDSAFQVGVLTYVPPVNLTLVENFTGASFSYYLRDSSYFFVDGEYFLKGNDYRFNLGYQSKFLNVGYSKIFYSPTLVQSLYRSNHFVWNNFSNFTKTMSDQFSVSARIKVGNLIIAPALNYQIIYNYIYFDTLAKPAQTDKKLTFLNPELYVKYNVWKIFLEGFAKYSINNASEAGYVLQVPSLFTHNRLYFQNSLFKKAAIVQFGVDMFWKSTYLANKYMPVTNQYYLNREFIVRNYTLLDVFLNVKIKTASIFLKVNNINQPADDGYFITPYYSGLPRNFEVGIKWMFFN
jgi:hypothetical protein